MAVVALAEDRPGDSVHVGEAVIATEARVEAFYDLSLKVPAGEFSPAGSTSSNCAAKVLTKIAPGTRVLDVGSGVGTLGLLAKKAGATSALLVDISPNAVAAARENAARNGIVADTRVADARELPSDLGTFDLIIANLPMRAKKDSLPDPTLAEEEFVRRNLVDEKHQLLHAFLPRAATLLAPGGRVIITNADFSTRDEIINRARSLQMMPSLLWVQGEYRVYSLEKVAPVIHVEDMSCRLRRPDRILLSGLSLTVFPSEIVGILGASGSGKTTLLRAISGLTDNDSTYDIKFNRRTIAEQTDFSGVAHDIGFVFQDPTLLSWRTVRSNVRLGPELTGDEPDQGHEGFFEPLGIQELLDRFPSKLSGGEKQRVALARALLLNPKTLFLDEPFDALDPFNRRDLNDLLRGFVDGRKLGALLVTHDMRETVSLCDHVLILAGRPTRIAVETPITRIAPRDNKIKVEEEIAAEAVRLTDLFREATGT